ncbi:MAG: hypothetical protein VX435_06645 [Planctomycetota bacterium]|jgi:hypothetical protein|nr:hypothetical protein [Planctomycetota bacterium]
MLRVFLFALGFFLFLLASELFMIDQSQAGIGEDVWWAAAGDVLHSDTRFDPPVWAFWMLAASSAIVVLYATALPKANRV